MTILLLVIYSSFISLGLPDSLLGAAWPVMSTFFGMKVSYAGVISFTVSGCTVVSSLSAMWLHRKLGTGRTVAFSTMLTGVSLLLFSVMPNFWLLIPPAVFLGLGAGAIDSAINNYVALHYPASQMSFLHCCWGVGASVGPVILSAFINRGSWQQGYRVIAVIQLCLGLIQFFSIKLWKDSDSGLDGGTKALTGGSAPGTRPFALLAFFFYSCMEAVSILWIPTYFVNRFSCGAAFAAKASTALFIGITGGRFLSGIISSKVGVKRIIFCSSVFIAASFVGLLLCSSQNTAIVLVFLIGLGMAPVFPSMIHRTPRRFGSQLSPKIIGQQMASAYLASTCIPPVMGILFNSAGFHLLPFFCVICACCLFAFTAMVEHKNNIE